MWMLRLVSGPSRLAGTWTFDSDLSLQLEGAADPDMQGAAVTFTDDPSIGKCPDGLKLSKTKQRKLQMKVSAFTMYAHCASFDPH